MQILGNNILIKPDVLPERTSSGNLVIPKNSVEMLPQWGTIIDCGSACEKAVKGDYVNFSRRSATVIVIDDTDHYIISEHRVHYMREQTK
jgi:co-chaperonin GroES (HSP10)